MKNLLQLTYFKKVFFSISFLFLAFVGFSQTSTFYDFNTPGDLSEFFTRGNTNTTNITQSTNTGLGSTGAVNIGNASAYEVYTTKQGYSNGGIGSVYEFSTFIKSEYNSGYSAIGFTSVSAQPHANSGNPAVCLGVSVHGGGFIFYNNSTADYGDWQYGGVVNASIFDLLNYGSPDKWYKIVLKITAQANSAYHLRLEIWPSDASGNLLYGSASAVQERTFTNTSIANSSVLYSYFGFGGYRVSNFDNYSMNLQGSTVIEQGAPVVVNGTAVLSPVLNNSIDIEGSVTDDRQDPVTERGFVWNTTGNPTINDQKIVYGSGQGNFTGTINNLASGTYYLRAFATNSAGSSYGNEQTVIVPTQPSTISVVESINDFVKTCASLPSESQTFSVSGSNLSSAIEIGSVTGLEYSLNGTTYQNTLTLNPVSGSVAATTVYVRMTATQISGFTDYISISATGALGYSIAANGTYTASFSVDTQPTVVNSQVCKDTSSETISFTTIGSDFSIQWYSNTTNSYTGATLISGATSNSLSLPTNIVGTKYYFAKLTANSGSCNVDTQVVSQTVIQNISNIGWISGTIDLASDATTTTYTIPVVSGATSYVWNLPSGMTRQSQTGNSITVAIAESFTSGTVSVYAQNDCGVTATRSFYSTKLTGGISFSVSGAPVICTNATATYTATTIANGVYSWTVPAGMTIVSGQGTNEISVSTDASFSSGNIKATCATSQYTYQSNYAVSGVALPSAITGPSNLCGLTTATYSVTNVPGTTYIWSLPEGMVVSGANNTSSINVTISGSVSGTISVQAQNSCGLSTPRYLAVNSAPIVGGINGVNRVCGAVQVTLDNQGNVVSNSALNSYTYSVAAVAGADSYLWTVPTGATIESGQGTNSITISYDLVSFESGNITVQAVNSSCGSGPIRSLTVSAVTGAISGPTNLCGLTSVSYSVPSDIGTDFVWTLPEGMSVSNGAGTSSISVLVAHPVNNSIPVSVQFATACGGTRTLSLGVSCSDYTNLIPSYCNSSSVSPSQWVDAQSISGATGYKFNIYTSTGVFITAIERSTYFFRFSQMNFTYGATYQVGVQVKQGEVYGAEGSRCNITLSQLPTTTLVSAMCNSSSVSPSQWVDAQSISGATGYKFNIYTSTGVFITAIERSTYFFRFSQMNFTYGATYQVGVQVKQGEVYGAEGSRCNITLSQLPTTTLVSAMCNSSSVSPSQWIDAQPISGATGYRFNIYTSSGEFITTIDRSIYFFRFSQMNFSYGTTYQVGVQVKQGEVYGNEGSRCNVTLSELPTTTLVTSMCGSTSVSPSQWIDAQPISGATGYRFNIYTSSGEFITTIDRSIYFFRFSQMNFSYGTTYQVGVQVKQGEVYGNEGSRCNVTLSELPTTTLVTSMCGSTSVSPSQWIDAQPISGATGYRFNIYTSSGEFITAIDRSIYFFRFSQMNFSYGTTYQVGVQAKQGLVYGTEGSRCTITLSGPPTTSIESAQCGTSILYTDAIYAVSVSDATGYKFNFYNQAGTTLVTSFESATNWFSFSQLTGYTFDTTYQVRVQVIRGTEYGVEGTACSITVLTDAPARALSNQDEIKTSMVSEFKAYPNPFTTTFSITPMERETATLFYQVYDVTGKMMESRSVEANEITNHTIGEQYPAGMYLVIVRQGANTQTFKMVKQ